MKLNNPGGKTLTLDGLPLICNTLTPGFDPGMASESFNQRLLTLKRLFLNRYKKVSEYDQEIPQSQTADIRDFNGHPGSYGALKR